MTNRDWTRRPAAAARTPRRPTRRRFAYVHALEHRLLFAAQVAPRDGFFSTDTLRADQAAADYNALPVLNDGTAAFVKKQLALAQSQGKTLAVRVNQSLTTPAAVSTFNEFAVEYVFTDFYDVALLGRSRSVADQVAASTLSTAAVVGNFNRYPLAGSDPTRPAVISGTAPRFAIRPADIDYGVIGAPTGKQMANEALWPGSPDFRNPAQGNSGAPNIRAALFTLPIQRATLSEAGLLGLAGVPTGAAAFAQPGRPGATDDVHVPNVTRFNNFGNPALDSDGNPANGFMFIQNAATPANGQLLSRGDFQAMMLHLRMRGAASVNLQHNTLEGGSVVGYSEAQAQSDVRSGWQASSLTNDIAGRGDYSLANLSNTIGDLAADTGDASARNTELSGAVWSGVYDNAASVDPATSQRRMSILISNLGNVQRIVDLPNNIGGFSTYRVPDPADPADFDNYAVAPGAHRTLEFSLKTSPRGLTEWVLDAGLTETFIGLDNNRNGIGLGTPGEAFGAISLVKRTNGVNHDAAPGVFVPIGSTVTFSYAVSNAGTVPLSGVSVRDDNGTPAALADDFNATFVGGDTNANGLLDLTETWTFTASRIATAGQYTNTGTAAATAAGSGPIPVSTSVSDSDVDNHFGGDNAAINLVKLTNGVDHNAAPGAVVPVGSTVTFTYVVTNPGTVPLSGVVVRDNNGTAANPADDFNATFAGGDTNANGLLDLTETWTFIASRIATAGQYTNVATATGTPPSAALPTPTDSDVDNHFGVFGAINLVKLTNGTDNNAAPGPALLVGSTATFTYVLTNPGNTPLSTVVLRDDSGTPAVPGDDFSPTFVGGDANGNGQLDTTETWTYTASRVVTVGPYANTAVATAFVLALGPAVTATDSDVDHHLGQLVTASVNDVSLAEGNAGTPALVFTVTLAAPATGTSFLGYATADGTATVAGGDYQPAAGTLTFIAGQTTQTVTVFLNGDTTFEPNETFKLNLGPVSGPLGVADGQGIGTVLNDDPAPPPPPVASAELGFDPTGRKALLISGTDGDDLVDVDPTSSRNNRFRVTINGVVFGEFDTSKFDRVVMHLHGGADHTGLSSKLTRDAFVFAGPGDDDIDAGSGRDVVIGGEGDDFLEGKRGRDLVIGGDGLDTIFGNEDDDLLVAAATTYDADFVALAALQKEWVSSNSYSTRVNRLKTGTGSNLGGRRLNDTTVLDDLFADVLTGNSNSDAFFVQTSSTGGAVRDTVLDKSSSEVVTDVN